MQLLKMKPNWLLPSSCEKQLGLIVSVTAQLLFIPQQVQAENFFFGARPSYCGRWIRIKACSDSILLYPNVTI